MELINNSVNKIIAEQVTSYLKNRMLINQRMIGLKPDNNSVSFKDFMDNYISLERRISNLGAGQNLRKRELLQQSKKYIRDHADSITLSEEEIDELMKYVAISIEECNFYEKPYTCNETAFLRVTLRKLRDKIKEELGLLAESDEDYQNLNKWLSFVYISKNVGFHPELVGQISIGYGEKFSIFDQDHKKIVQLTNAGDLKIGYSPKEEDILIADDIYIGYFYNGDIKLLIPMLEKTIDGRKIYKAFYHDNSIYPTKLEEKDIECVFPIIPINRFFELKNLPSLARPIYNRSNFQNTIYLYNQSTVVKDEEKEQLEKIIEAAVNWWVDTINHPKLDVQNYKNLTDPFDAVSMLREIVDFTKPRPDEDTINKFRTSLSNIIRRELLSNNSQIFLTVDVSPNKYLSEAARDAGLDINFPNKIKMIITREGILLSTRYEPFMTYYYSVNHEEVDSNPQKIFGKIK